MSPRGLWIRVVATTAVGAALMVVVSPARPAHHVPVAVAPAAGAVVGALLFLGGARRVPRLPSARGSFPVLFAKQGLLGLWAANEEIVWRRVALGELLAVGAVAAVFVSSLGFALAHRRRRALHLGTGAAFGGVYLGTGSLGASVAAHWLYNVFVSAHVERAHAPAGVPP